MKRIDAHQHFWHFDPVRDSWINQEMKVIQRDFIPEDLQPLLIKNDLDGCIAVQASQSEEETKFLISLAKEHDFIAGVVGWVDLQAKDIMKRLANYKLYPVVKGFRHVLQGEAERDLMLHTRFKRGIAALQQYGFTYDILIFPDQLKFSSELVAAFPDQKFVVDHIAKPYIKRGEIAEWKADIEKLASYPNVYCKISGMVTEGNWTTWKQEDFRPYMDVVVRAFGTNRIMFGSDWPVCEVAASYDEVVNIVKNYFSAFTQGEQAQFFGLNAIQFYNL
jgi:L-fuconolactonase